MSTSQLTGPPSSCVVTGGARGIGRGIAELMVARGHQVVIGDLDGRAAAATAAEIGAVAGLAQDVRDPDAHRLVAEEAARHGVLTAWFNNAGVGDDGSLADLSEEQVRRLVEVNLLGTTWGTRAALAAFGAAGGDVVNIASLAGPRAGAGLQHVRRHEGRRRLAVDLRQRRGAARGAGARPVPGRGRHRDARRPGPVRTRLAAGRTPAARSSSVAEVAAAAVALVGSRRVVRTVPALARGSRAWLRRSRPGSLQHAAGLFAVQGRRAMRRR